MPNLTDEKIADLLGRITPGPWRACGADRGGCTCGQVWSLTAGEWVATSKHTGSRDVQCATANAEAIALVPDLLAEVARLRVLLRRWQCGGCPDCQGDCASANPPVLDCIVRDTAEALRGGEK